MKIAVNYTIFAILATIANIGAQDITVRFYQGSFDLWVSIFIGTGVGLVVKYVLDKKFIFKFVTKNAAQDGKLFFLYSCMGLVTTAIFWGFEFAFDTIFDSKTMRYTGGVIGLAIGYFIKYLLDKKFVFVYR